MFENLNPEYLSRWLAILEDPNSTQAQYKLCDDTGAKCCLGHGVVAIYPKTIWRQPAEDSDNYTKQFSLDNSVTEFEEDDDNFEVLSSENLTKMGLSREEQDFLIKLNDDRGFSLSEIARVIRNYGNEA